MNTMPTPPADLYVVEDGGLNALTRRVELTAEQGRRATTTFTPELMVAVRDLLLDQLHEELLDPVTPPSVRHPAILAVLRQAIGVQKDLGVGPLRELPTDEQTLLTIYCQTIGWGPAQPYLDDERIQEVKINGTRIMVQEDGNEFVMVPEEFEHPKLVLDRAVVLASRLRVQLDMAHPQGSLPLAHGTRMHVTIPPCTPEQHALVCIRRGRRYAWALDDIMQRGGFSRAVGDLLLLLAHARCSFLIAGETGTGKTALLEAIINSWPGEPHVITIEDNMLEINVRHAAWTRELVQTSVERGAFGRAAREALRQTPTVVAPGEIRADEAGAVLAIAVSGHAVVSTLHARSCAAAVQRFADCAAMPGAYIYEGRRQNALEDACDNLDVIIHLEKMAGRRYIHEIVLLNGYDTVGPNATPRPHLIPLVKMHIGPEGQICWHTYATAAQNGLRWEDGHERTPAPLERKLRLLNLEQRVRVMATTRATMEDAIQQAKQSVVVGNIPMAIQLLKRTWSERRDQRLIEAMAMILAAQPDRMEQVAAHSLQVAAEIEAHMSRRAWAVARARLEQAHSDLEVIAALRPPGRWAQMQAQIALGEQADQLVSTQVNRARRALRAGVHPLEVMRILDEAPLDRCSHDVAQLALTVRRDALQILVQRGEGGSDALAATMARLDSTTPLPTAATGG